MDEELSQIKSIYYLSLGYTGFASYFRPSKYNKLGRLWFILIVFICLPMTFTFHTYTALFTDIPYSERFLALSIALDEIQTIAKAIYTLYLIDKFKNVMVDFPSFAFIRHVPKETIKQLEEKSKEIIRLQNMFQYIAYMVIVSWVLVPLVMSPAALFYGTNSGSISKVLPCNYPFRIDYVPLIQIIFCFETVTIIGALLLFSGINLFHITTIMFLCIMFKLLSDSLLNYDNPLPLKSYIKDHQVLLRISGEIKKLLSPVLAMQLAVSVLTLCFSIFEFTRVDEENQGGIEHAILYIRKTSYTICIFTELVFYCWLSTKLQEAAAAVRDGVYNGSWYLKKVENYREIIIIGMRSLKPIRLTALSMVKLHLGTSLEVLRLAYSYYTLLQQMNR